MVITSGDSVTIEYTGRLDDDTVFDTSRERVAEETGLAEHQPGREYAPLTVEVGTGSIIEGIDEALLGMEEGDEATVDVPPAAGYGERSEERIEAFGRSSFEDALQEENPAEGMRVQTQQGGLGEVVHVDSTEVRVDFNHELAGEHLEFDVEVVSVE